MNRTAALLSVLMALLLVVASFFFLIKPKMDEVTELEAEAEDIRAEQQTTRTQIAQLEEVRATSPNLEAELAAISAIVPDTPALPSTLRQLQVAADDSGVTLVSVAPSAPTSAGVAEIPELSTISVSMTLEGGYFQVVDFLRRLEDPLLTARGMLVNDVAVSPGEYPTLSVTMSASMFSMLDQPVQSAPEAEATDEPTDGETDVEVDVDVTEEDAA